MLYLVGMTPIEFETVALHNCWQGSLVEIDTPDWRVSPMGRPPVIPAEKKLRIVLSVLAGEVTIVQAARKENVSEQSISRWKAEFLEAGKAVTRPRC